MRTRYWLGFRGMGVFLVAMACCFSVAGSAWATPNYDYGQTGNFGNLPGWNYTGAVYMGTAPLDPNAAWSAATAFRFKAYQDATIDQLGLRFVRWGTNVARYGIQADDGAGKPDGTWLASGTATPAITTPAKYNLTSDANLTAGNVYHVVVQMESGAVTLETDNSVYCSNDGGIHRRPIDNALDDTFDVLNYNQRATGGPAWEPYRFLAAGVFYDQNPFFSGWNNGVAVAIGGNSCENVIGSTSGLRNRGNTTTYGQTFMITDAEIAAGNQVQVGAIKLNILASGSPTANLLIKIREADGDVLATAICTPAEADATLRSFALDQQVVFDPGVKYLITTEFSAPQANTVYYNLMQIRTNTVAMAGAADSYLGVGYEAIMTGTGSLGSWYPGGVFTYVPVSVNHDDDMLFGFEGLVIPEPMTLGLLAFGGLAVVLRRKR